MKSWYVAKTKPAKERWIETYFTERLGIDVFLPIIRRPGGTTIRWEPLFPSYLFSRIDVESDDWSAIRWAPGLSYFLGYGECLCPVSDEVIANLKQRISWWNDGGYAPRFVPGQRLVVISGPFSGLEAVFQKYLPSRQRCQVLLEVLGQAAKTELIPEVLSPASPYRGLARPPLVTIPLGRP